jgi:hypothetical protein
MHIDTARELDQAVQEPCSNGGVSSEPPATTIAAVADMTIACTALDCGYSALFWRQVDQVIARGRDARQVRPRSLTIDQWLKRSSKP